MGWSGVLAATGKGRGGWGKGGFQQVPNVADVSFLCQSAFIHSYGLSLEGRGPTPFLRLL